MAEDCLARPQAAAKQDRPEPQANWSLLGAGLEPIGSLFGAGWETVGRRATEGSPCQSLWLSAYYTLTRSTNVGVKGRMAEDCLARPQAAAKQDRPEPQANWSLLGAGLEPIGSLFGAGWETVGRRASVASPS